MSPENNAAIETDTSWDEPLAESHEPATFTLDERGLIRDCSKAGGSLFGYRRSDLIRQHASRLFPQLAEVALVENGRINPRLGFLSHCGHHFMGQDQQGNTFFSKLNFIRLDNADKGILKLMVQPAGNAVSP